MKKQTLADKLAEKSFRSAQIQKSWATHMAAFGPILEPAFADDYQSRIHLTAALNHISNRNIAQGLDKLKGLQKACVTDADRTALLFFFGVCSEMAGKTEQAITFYGYANEYGHRLSMPYLKTAKFHLGIRLFDQAEKDLRAAIGCYTGTGLSQQDKLILGSAYTNLATCLTSMHRYEEAEEALSTSRSLYPDAPGRAAIEAVLHALQGRAEELNACMEELRSHTPDAAPAVQESIDRILAGTDPLFFPVCPEDADFGGFWQWFQSYSEELLAKLNRQAYEDAITPVSKKLLELFPFLEEPAYISLGKNEKGYVLELKDFYATGISDAYERLLNACPESIKEQWQFVMIH